MGSNIGLNISRMPFFFIIGRPRSGTTLLRTLLDAHPQIKIPPEYPVILEVFNKYRKVRRWNSGLIENFLNDYKKAEPAEIWKYDYLRIDEPGLRKALMESGENVDFPGLIKIIHYYYKSVFDKENVSLLGDKNPLYATYLKRLMHIFPDAKFIFITRDYRDNFLSISKFNFEAPHVILQSYRWKYVVRQYIEQSRKFPERFMHIRYEDLATDPEAMLKTVCIFLEVNFDPAMTEFHKKAHEAYHPAAKQEFMKFHEGLTRPISGSQLFAWKQTLDKHQIEKADATVGKYAEQMGYQRQLKDSGRSLQLRIMFWSIYGYCLYKAMEGAEHLPYAVRKRVSVFLPYLSRIYHKLFVQN